MKEKVDVELYVEERDNEGARDNGSGRKIREIVEHKRNFVRVTTVPPVNFSGEKNKDQIK